jgi:hypothetical protein
VAGKEIGERPDVPKRHVPAAREDVGADAAVAPTSAPTGTASAISSSVSMSITR